MASFHTVNPAANQTLHLGQYNQPSWSRYEQAMCGIFARRYYTNEGPLAREFGIRLQDFLGVRHAVCVANPTIGLMMAIEALGIKGRAWIPAICNQALRHALAWCGVEPIYGDVDSHSGQPVLGASVDQADALIGANMWGGASEYPAFAEYAATHSVPLLIDSLHGFGCKLGDGAMVGSLAPIEVLSFDGRGILNAAGAACVTTGDDELAARLRNIRSSYGAGRPVPVEKTSNGRMSEAQAALGLLSLEDLEINRAHNRTLFQLYRERLAPYSTVEVVVPHGVADSNHEMLICRLAQTNVGEKRTALIAHLVRNNVEARAIRAVPSALAQSASVTLIDQTWFTLPLGAHIGERAAQTVCDLVIQALTQQEGV